MIIPVASLSGAGCPPLNDGTVIRHTLLTETSHHASAVSLLAVVLAAVVVVAAGAAVALASVESAIATLAHESAARMPHARG